MVEAAVDASAVTALPAKDTIAVAVAGIEGVHTRSSPKFVGSESAPNRVSAAAPAERVPSCAAGEEVTAAPTDEAAAGSARNERVATGAATDLTAASIVREHIVGTPPSMDEHLAGTTLKRLGRPAHAGRPGQVSATWSSLILRLSPRKTTTWKGVSVISVTLCSHRAIWGVRLVQPGPVVSARGPDASRPLSLTSHPPKSVVIVTAT
jgi:hypothetical protein